MPSAGNATTTINAKSITSQGHATITFTIVTACGNVSYSRQIWVGKPGVISSQLSTGGGLLVPGAETPRQVCTMINYSTVMTISSPSTNVWSRTAANPTTARWYSQGDNIKFYFFAAGQTATFRLTSTNSCGSTLRDYYFRSITCTPGDDCPSKFSLSPNPSQTSIKVSSMRIPAPCPDYIKFNAEDLQEEKALEKIELGKEKERIVRVFNFNGQEVKTQILEEGREDVDVSDLQKGLYVVKITEGDHTETHRLQVD
jgi:hypothetical protein